MCGVPYHAAENYIAKLIKAGRRVAICDQTSEPQAGKIVSARSRRSSAPGTVSELHLLEAKRNNYLAAVYAGEGRFGFAFVDLTTGDFRLTEVASSAALVDELARVQPAEVLVSDEQQEQFGELERTLAHDSYAFLPEQATFTLREHFKVQSLDGFGCGEMRRPSARRARSCTISSTSCGGSSITSRRCAAMRRPSTWSSTRRRRRISSSSHRAARATPAARRARSHGHADGRAQTARLDSASAVRSASAARAAAVDRRPAAGAGPARLIRAALKSVRDIERTVGRLSQIAGNARDLVVLRTSLEQIPQLKRELQKCSIGSRSGTSGACTRTAVATRSQRRRSASCSNRRSSSRCSTRAVVDEPPVTLKDGGIFRDGFDASLDELRRASREGKNWIAELQEREIDATGHQVAQGPLQLGLRLFHRDHEIEPRAGAGALHRKQTTVGGERFITPELKEMEGRSSARTNARRQLEYELFQTAPRPDARASRRHPADRGGRRHARCALRARGDGAALQLLAARSSTSRCGSPSRTAATRCSTRISSRRNSCRTTPRSTATRCACRSSPARTWRANRPTSGRSRCSS